MDADLPLSSTSMILKNERISSVQEVQIWLGFLLTWVGSLGRRLWEWDL